MNCTIFAAAAALLASTAIFASFDDAEARSFGRGGGAGGMHRMSARSHVHANHVNRASHVGHANVTHAKAGLHNGTRPGNRHVANKQAAGAFAKSSNSGHLKQGPQKQAQRRTYREMGMDNTPQANNNTPSQTNTPPKANGGSNQPQNNGKPGKLTNGPNTLPKNHLVNQGKIPIWISKPVDWGVTYFVPVYGPVKTTVDTYQNLKPKVEQTLKNSELSNKLHDEAIKAEKEAAEARREQGGGVFQPSGLNDPSLMDP